MKLIIVSHTEHYLRDGKFVGWGPTVREISHLATIFDEIVHIATLIDSSPPVSAIPYESSRDNIRLELVKPSGGAGLANKLGILLQYPRYAQIILREVGAADVVHVRAPANIALLALLLLPFLRRPTKRWIKYAGNWKPDAPDALSYRVQRWLIKRGWHRGQVTVNGHWLGDPLFVHSFLNPCLTDEEWSEGVVTVTEKSLTFPLRLLFVGRLESAKGVSRALKVAARLQGEGIDVQFDLIGDGPERRDFENEAKSLGIADQTRFHGWIERGNLAPFYEDAHFLLFLTASEGWPKVVSEGMAYGVIPLVSAVSSIPEYLHDFGVGLALPPMDIDAFVEGIHAYLDEPSRWNVESERASRAAARFTYSRFLEDVRQLLDLPIPQSIG